MKWVVVGLGIVALVAVLGWLIAFGAKTPCAALQVEAQRMGDKDVVAKAILDGIQDGTLSSVECFGLAVRTKAMGRKGVTVLHLKTGNAK